MIRSASLCSRAKIYLRVFGVLGILVILALSCLPIAWIVREHADRTILKEKYAVLRTRGVPTDNASLTQWYRSMTDPRDVEAWERVFSELRSQESGKTFDASLMDETELLRRRIRELAGKRSPVQFVKNFDSLNTPLPHLQDLRRVQQLLAIEFQASLIDGDADACCAAILTMLDVAQVCSKEPFFNGQIANVDLHDQALRSIHWAVEQDLFNEPQIELLLSTMSRDEIALHRFRHMVQGERAAMIEVAENLAKYPGFDTNSYANRTIFELVVPTTNRDVLHLLEFYEGMEVFDTADIDVLQLQSIEHTKALDNRVRSADALEKSDWTITSRVTPNMILTLDALVRNAVQERFVRHALAIRLYQKRYGCYPDDLESLRQIGFESYSWKPWGGRPFGYRVCDGEALLWATHPQEGPFTTDDPPHLDERSVLADFQKMLHMLFRVAKS